MIDRELLEKSSGFDELVDTYVIFITEKDHFGKGLPMYHIERKITELGDESFGDGTHIIYVNGEYREKDSLGKLMHDFTCKRAGEMFYPTIAERVKYFKEKEGGHGYMNKLFEEWIEEECAKREKKTRHAEAVKFAQTLIKCGKFSEAEIADMTSLPLEEVKELSRGRTA